MARTATATREQPAQTQQPPRQAPTGNPPATAEAAKAPHPLVAFKQYMDQRLGEIALALPPQISPDRFARVMLTALQRKPELLKCTRQSLFNACMLAAQDGLLPDGREGAIAPYGEGEGGKRVAEIATWMPMVEGLRKKARNSGEISNWEVHIVRQRDHFEVILGDNPRIDHKPYFGSEDPGEIVGAYSIAWLKDGTISRDVMTIRDINKIKAKSKAKNGPWSDPTFVPEMCKKTVARRHYKQLPHASDLDAMMRRDDEAFGFDERSEDQIETRQQRRVGSTAAAFDAFSAAGAAPVIDHDDEPTGTRDDPHPDEDIGGEFEDEAPSQQTTKPEATKAQPKQKANAAPKAQPSNEPPADEPGGDELSADDNQQPGEPEGEATTAATWPADKKPTNEAEYELYAAAYLASATDGEAIAGWFKGPDQRALRNACGVTKEGGFDRVKSAAMARIAELKKA